MTTTPKNHLTERFDEALVYASCIHRDQRRKGADIPYVSHLLGVAAIAIENGATEDQAIAALLHDAVEDQGFVFSPDYIVRIQRPCLSSLLRHRRHDRALGLAWYARRS